MPREWVIPQQKWLRRFESTQRKLGRKFSESLKLLLEPESRRQSTCLSALLTCPNTPVKSVWWDHILAFHSDLVSFNPDHHSPQPFKNPSLLGFHLLPKTTHQSHLSFPQTPPCFFSSPRLCPKSWQSSPTASSHQL